LFEFTAISLENEAAKQKIILARRTGFIATLRLWAGIAVLGMKAIAYMPRKLSGP